MRRYGFGVTEELLMRLVTEVCGNREPTKLALLAQMQSRRLSETEREEIREMLADELVESGLDSEGEPNERGRLIEAAIDWLGHR